MGKGAPSAPAAPDPTLTAQAQSQANIQTAQAQAQLNNVNQYTPYGSLVYTQTPTAGNPNQWTATQTLSPQEQQLQNMSWAGQNVYGQTALNELSNAATSLSNPINTNWNQVQNQYINTQMGLLQPQLNLQQQTLNSTLANQGVAQGSNAWNNAQMAQNNLVAQTYGQVLNNAQSGVGAAIQQQESLRDQPLNEASALLTGSQIQQPGGLPTSQTSVSPTDVLGAYGQQQQAQQYAYGQQEANYSATMGGAAGLIGTAATAAAIIA